MERLRKKYPVTLLLNVMDLNRSGYYKWIKRKDKPNRYEQDRIVLTNMIKEVHKKHSCYGYHKIATVIRSNTGWYISDNLVHKCCKVAGIRSMARKTYNTNKGKEHITYPNLIYSNWNATKPMEIVCSDMTILKNKKCQYEWTFILDTFNNEIIASSLSSLVGDRRTYLSCINQLVKKAKEQTKPIIFHTDQGSVYSSKAFFKAHEHCTNIIRSMSRAGTPTDNPIIEAVNGWVKEELYKDFDLYHSDDVPKLIDEYISYFNNERPSVKCNYKSPVHFKLDWTNS